MPSKTQETTITIETNGTTTIVNAPTLRSAMERAIRLMEMALDPRMIISPTVGREMKPRNRLDGVTMEYFILETLAKREGKVTTEGFIHRLLVRKGYKPRSIDTVLYRLFRAGKLERNGTKLSLTETEE